eukprot:GHVQ01004465.1.p1 GENE.GHVQ01004465.1~~GHVQ01004465.1.p1  ORF type:complete len:142 (+),score=4.15 GHVQ01004465.1:188-613(+)
MAVYSDECHPSNGGNLIVVIMVISVVSMPFLIVLSHAGSFEWSVPMIFVFGLFLLTIAGGVPYAIMRCSSDQGLLCTQVSKKFRRPQKPRRRLKTALRQMARWRNMAMQSNWRTLYGPVPTVALEIEEGSQDTVQQRGQEQ